MSIFGKLFGRKGEKFPDLPDFSASTDNQEFTNPDVDEGSWNPKQETFEQPMLDNQLSPATPYESKRREEMAGFHVPDISSPRGTVSGENAYGTITPKDVQLILSKLDLINSRLDNINRRLEMLESGKKAGQNLW